MIGFFQVSNSKLCRTAFLKQLRTLQTKSNYAYQTIIGECVKKEGKTSTYKISIGSFPFVREMFVYS